MNVFNSFIYLVLFYCFQQIKAIKMGPMELLHDQREKYRKKLKVKK